MRVHEAGALHADINQHSPAWLRAPVDVNALLPPLWPRTVERDAGGVVRVGGVRVTDLAAEFGTPWYVLDEADFRHRARAYRDAFRHAFAPAAPPQTGTPGPDDGTAGGAGQPERAGAPRHGGGDGADGTGDAAGRPEPAGGPRHVGGTGIAGGAGADVYYAGKAFLCKAVVRWLAADGLSLDVCSGGELAVARSAGFDPARIGFHGNNKSVSELERAVDAGVGRIIVDSFAEIERLAAITARRGVSVPVMVRVTVGVEAHTHEYIATAHEDQKFGFSLHRGKNTGGGAAEAVRAVLAAPGLELIGLHSHIGSQIYDAQGFEISARRVLGLAAAIRDEHGIELPELDLGGGFGIAYTTQDDPFEPAEIAEALAAIVAHECAGYGLAVPRISIEPGRSICGPAVFTLYEVGTVKDVELDGGAIRRYVSVDGGMSDNIRTALYDASYSCTVANRASDAPPVLARVVGKHCESGDIVVRDEFLPADVRPGDLVAVPGTGAYTRCMASNYNHVPRPGVLSVADGAVRTVMRAETEDDLLRLDVG